MKNKKSGNVGHNKIGQYVNSGLIGSIYIYRKYISPAKGVPSCRFRPTCSQYAIEALRKYGPIKGTILSAKRILRCNHFSKGGYDPVP
ncbi:MAG: membrane protein insertion efficiency factor YidD [Lachnospiraceae bacterium]|nr:membrane protein insertion efficiency factor YidD [Lachnospiraceae bacterium]